MTPDMQEKIILELADSITDKIISRIRAGLIPADWDSVELRWLMADNARDAVLIRGWHSNDSRRKAYVNTRLINNL